MEVVVNKKRRVAIIGAGPSGLVSAKYALEYGLEPVVFEKSSQISGMWSTAAIKNTSAWVGSRTNTMRHLLTFSDHAWCKETARMYPFANEMHEYLQSYAKKFNLNKYIRLGHKVEFVKCLMDANKSWQVRYQTNGTKEKKTETFDFLIVASGAFETPNLPPIEDRERFKGLIMHSSEFHNKDSRLAHKNVVVVGGSSRAVQIAADLVGHVGSVHHVFRRQPLIFPLLWKLKLEENRYSIMPYEFFYFTRSVCHADQKEKNEIIKKFASFQTGKNCPESLRVNLDHSDENEYTLTLSDTYFSSMEDSKIVPVKSIIKRFFENGVLLENDQYVPTDVVIFCTGFKPAAAEYLDKPILDMIRFKEDKHCMPALLYKEVFAPGLETMAYVGLNRMPCFIGYEMQAKWANAVFVGKIDLPERSRMEEFVARLEVRRNTMKNHQLAYGEYPELMDNYAQELGIMPDLDMLKENNKELYDYLWNDIVCWPHYLGVFLGLNNPYEMLKEIRDFKSQVYELNYNEDKIKQTDVIKEFSKNYLF